MSAPPPPPRMPIRVEFSVTGRNAQELEDHASAQLLLFAAGRKWQIESLDAKSYIETQSYGGGYSMSIVSWRADVVGRVGK